MGVETYTTFKDNLMASGVVDTRKGGVHHEFIDGDHGLKVDFGKDIILPGTPLYSQWMDVGVEFIGTEYDPLPDIIVGVADGTNQPAIDLAKQFEGVLHGTTRKDPSGSGALYLTSETKKLLKHNQPEFALVFDDTGTTGSTTLKVVRLLMERGISRIEVLYTWQRSVLLKYLEEAGVPYKSILYEPLPNYAPNACDLCVGGLKLIKHKLRQKRT